MNNLVDISVINNHNAGAIARDINEINKYTNIVLDDISKTPTKLKTFNETALEYNKQISPGNIQLLDKLQIKPIIQSTTNNIELRSKQNKNINGLEELSKNFLNINLEFKYEDINKIGFSNEILDKTFYKEKQIFGYIDDEDLEFNDNCI